VNARASRSIRQRRVRRSPAARGAIFVEAIIIIASMTAMFLGLVFFRVLYVNATITSRLARGGAIAYSMSGCDKILPKDWIAKDAKKYTILPPNPPSTDTAKTDQPLSTTGNASSATNGLPGLNGGNFLNPIAEVADTTTVSSYTGGGFLQQKRTVFKQKLSPRSFVTCGDIVRNGSFEEVFSYAKSAFGGKGI
jgi:hypothetical protein